MLVSRNVQDLFTGHKLGEVVNNHITIVQILALTQSNPQGDPDDDNNPRVMRNGHAFMTPMGYKRKVRDVVLDMFIRGFLGEGYNIFVQSGVKYNTLIEGVHDKVVLPNRKAGEAAPKKKAKAAKDGEEAASGRSATAPERDTVTREICRQYYDCRAFGQVLATGDQLGDNATGPVQVETLISADRVFVNRHAITCRAVASEKQADRNMGSRAVVEFAVMPAVTCINPHMAQRTGWTYNDLAVYLYAIHNMWDATRSGGRSGISVVATLVFFHKTAQGEYPRTRAPLHKIKECLKLAKADGVDLPESLKDYTMSVDTSGIDASAVDVFEYDGNPLFRTETAAAAE